MCYQCVYHLIIEASLSVRTFEADGHAKIHSGVSGETPYIYSAQGLLWFHRAFVGLKWLSSRKKSRLGYLAFEPLLFHRSCYVKMRNPALTNKKIPLSRSHFSKA